MLRHFIWFNILAPIRRHNCFSMWIADRFYSRQQRHLYCDIDSVWMSWISTDMTIIPKTCLSPPVD
jgi:hypothetical protein